ncbi:MAG TPA: tetratricopeptide repeat protein [Vitreimonas sp.]|uniref:tetratricopeptide repeat protein n=1 Tax=Vitreimonas sp. TaxID=3069702 RepID=UPI002D2C7024|nr:tetratricopeptide repeat protein [Vitreimonas sp.]HYD86312.1 tetratricopeptide repeat protein [Vitreimonas sp.]
MRARVMAIAFWCALAASTAAIPYIPPPQPVYEAPIDRALENVAAMEGLDPAQREQLLGRLNLLAYARDDGAFTYMRENHEFVEAGPIPCAEAYPQRYPPPEAPQSFPPDAFCAAFDFALGPRSETPNLAPQAPGDDAMARLEAARTHYARALALQADNLRARLGYAYTLDRLGRLREARRQLRDIMRRGMPRLAGAQSEWEDHAVLTETAAHLGHLATSRSDRARVERLRARLEASQPIIYVTPIVVPLSDAPFERLIDTRSDVAFDFAGTGDTRAQGWLTADAAWLVWDPEWRGEVRSGFDLIGQRTWAVFWSDGFEALRALDDNRDGELTAAELGGLSLWRDEDGDGISDPGEVLPANVHGIAALSVRGEPTRRGLITAPAGVRFEDGRTRPLYDWTPGPERAAVS